MEINVHIHLGDDKKFDRILELMEKWQEAEIQLLIKKVKGIIEDVKSTPTT